MTVSMRLTYLYISDFVSKLHSYVGFWLKGELYEQLVEALKKNQRLAQEIVIYNVLLSVPAYLTNKRSKIVELLYGF